MFILEKLKIALEPWERKLYCCTVLSDSFQHKRYCLFMDNFFSPEGYVKHSCKKELRLW